MNDRISARRVRAAFVLLVSLGAAACAGATVGSGVGDTYLERAPWYAGRIAEGNARIVHLPIRWQGDPTDFDPERGPGSAVERLVAEMNGYLAGLRAGAALETAPMRGTAPDVQFGCETRGFEDCADHDGRMQMRLAVARPSAAWSEWLGQELAAAGADAALVITLEVGDWWPRQKNWRGSKEIELGAGYAVPLPWLTALDAPVSVLQLTGARVGPDGRAQRIGAEGLLARRTNIVLAGFGAQTLITEADVAAVLEARRDDLPGRPLVWQVALRNLVAGLGAPPDQALATRQ